MLTDRQLDILYLIIKIYTETDAPVGSKTLMNEGIQASSATIRNDMGVLEELGFIEKTHSSSGRIPSVKGYRFYVDHLLKPTDVASQDRLEIRRAFAREFHAINDIVETAASILSDLTSYTAFSLGPEVKERKLTGFRLIPLNHQQVMTIIVTDKGNVESQVFSIPQDMSSEDLEKVVKIINDKLVGQPLITVYNKLRTEIPLVLQRYFHTPSSVMHFFDSVMAQAFEDRIFVSGKMNILDYDSLTDMSEFKSIYSLMDDEEAITSLIIPSHGDISIRIGEELENDLLENMSLMTASYEVNGHGKGTIALLGPTNMSYARMFGLLDVFRYEVADQLSDYYRSLESPH
ncbi:heat-inducible transcriptional repressor HrcA [Vagococcus humatus]|uniref:Heat-inducible transcription repressor HrcA n=1 Tax=Vagococcus humatus TaxID=1889241 RepID=A0A3R9YF52_9ENTE|nr:heat-inducible transcriptional repressor HrcA [Vagococcus humatus]RST89772.1 heat-inducible transcriptional repressor HrcA [Vagococcus humatus]